MKKLYVLALSVVLMVATGVAFSQGIKALNATLIGFKEVPTISTVGDGKFQAQINEDDTEIQYELSYSDLEGNVQQAHIHFGQTGVNGGITVFLCTNLGNGPVGTQACPPSPATITGTITANEVSPDITATAAARAQGLARVTSQNSCGRYAQATSTSMFTLIRSREVKSEANYMTTINKHMWSVREDLISRIQFRASASVT